MKITKYLFGMALLSLAMAFTACDTENEGTLYKSDNANVSWELKAVKTTTAESSITVPVTITRANKSGALTVHYAAEASEDGIFSDTANGTVNFNDGETMKTINVTASNLAKGETYEYAMTIDDAAFADADTTLANAVQKIVVTIVSDYTWEEVGSCTFYDMNFNDGSEGVEGIPILQALENPTLYRIDKPYQRIYTKDEDVEYFASTASITFSLDADGNAADILIDGGELGLDYTFCYDPKSYASYCYFFNEGNEFQCGHLIGVGGVPTYVGGFAFIWDEGYPGEVAP